MPGTLTLQGILWAIPIAPLPQVDRVYSEGQPHHITLWYGADQSAIAHLIGSEFTAQITAICVDDWAQVFRVTLPPEIPFRGEIPHITISYPAHSAPVRGGEAAKSGRCTPLQWEGRFKIEFKEWETQQ